MKFIYTDELDKNNDIEVSYTRMIKKKRNEFYPRVFHSTLPA